jgi:hypothetical protein
MRDFGIDTTWLTSPVTALHFLPDNRLKLDTTTDQATGKVENAKRLYTRVDGVSICGNLARYNTPDFQFSVAAPNRAGAVPRARLQLSAAAFAPDGDNLSLHNADSLHDAMRRVEAELAGIGVVWALASARVAKVAITRQFEVVEPIPHHMRVLGSCGVSRRAKVRDYGDTGVTIGNGQRTQTGYAKREEMREHGKDYTRCPENLLRMEATLSTRPAVKSGLAVESLPELCTAAKWALLPTVYFDEWQREAFKPRNEPLERACFDWDSILDEAAAAARPKTVLSGVWAFSIVEQMGLRRAQTQIQERWPGRGNRDKRGVLLRDLVDASTRLEMEKVTPHGSPFRALYLELQAKTLAPLLLAA